MLVYDTSFETEEVTMKNYFLTVFNCIFYFVLKEMNFTFLSTETRVEEFIRSYASFVHDFYKIPKAKQKYTNLK